MPQTSAVHELLTRYRAGYLLLRGAAVGLDEEAIRARPVPGKMSTLEVIAHIVDADQLMCDRMKRTIGTDRPLLIGIESADYPEPLDYQSRVPELELQLLKFQRQQMAEDLERLPEEAWSRTAVHSEIGLVTLVDLLEHAVEHLEDHTGTIAEKRAALCL
jgi:uncharacterized damage-inducible protein DinB